MNFRVNDAATGGKPRSTLREAKIETRKNGRRIKANGWKTGLKDLKEGWSTVRESRWEKGGKYKERENIGEINHW